MCTLMRTELSFIFVSVVEVVPLFSDLLLVCRFVPLFSFLSDTLEIILFFSFLVRSGSRLSTRSAH